MPNKYTRSGILIIFILLFGKILGFLKQLIVGWTFGANQGTDIYFMAEGFVAAINNIVFAALGVAFLRTYVEKKETGSDKELRLFTSNLLFLTCFAAIILTVVFNFAAPWLSRLLGLTYEGAKIIRLTAFLRYLSPIFLLFCLTNLMGTILDGEKLFIHSKLSGVISSVCYIAVCVLLGKKYGANSLVFANIIGYMVFAAYLLVIIIKKTSFRLCWPGNVLSTGSVVLLAVPIALGNAVVDLNHVIDKSIASGLEDGSVSALYYGQIASSDLINGIFVFAISTALVSYFTTLAVNEQREEIISKSVKLLDGLLILMVPVTIIYLFLSKGISRVLFGHGALDESGIRMIAVAMTGYAVGFPFIIMREILVKVHYAYNDMKRPMINGLLAGGLNIFMSITLSRFIGLLGITLATSISVIIAVVLLEYSVKKNIDTSLLPSRKNLVQIMIAGAASAVFIQLLMRFTEVSIYITVPIGVGAFAVFIEVMLLLKNEIVTDVTNKALNKLRKNR